MNESRNDREVNEEMRELAKRAQSGDEKAFNALLREYTPLILSSVSHVGADLGPEDRDDLLQEARFAFCRAVETYAPEKGAFGAYAKTVVKNRLIDLKRSMSSRPPEDPIDEATTGDAGDDPAAAVMEREAVEALKKLIRIILSSSEAEVCWLLAQNHTSREIAEILGKDLHSIENTVSRIRRKLGKARGTRN